MIYDIELRVWMEHDDSTYERRAELKNGSWHWEWFNELGHRVRDEDTLLDLERTFKRQVPPLVEWSDVH